MIVLDILVYVRVFRACVCIPENKSPQICTQAAIGLLGCAAGENAVDVECHVVKGFGGRVMLAVGYRIGCVGECVANILKDGFDCRINCRIPFFDGVSKFRNT